MAIDGILWTIGRISELSMGLTSEPYIDSHLGFMHCSAVYVPIEHTQCWCIVSFPDAHTPRMQMLFTVECTENCFGILIAQTFGS